MGKPNKPQLRAQNAIQDTMITVCTDCEWGIFPQHARIWTRRGLVHTSCDAERVCSETKGA